MSDLAAAKSHMRATLRQRWRQASTPGSVTPQLLPVLLDQLRGASAPTVAGFIRHGHEVDVEPLLRDLMQHGVAIALPRVTGDDLVFTRWDGVTLVEGAYGLLEPAGDPNVDIADLTIVLAPAMACALDGVRLGRGGGYYDRALRHLRSHSFIIGIVTDDAVLPAGEIPREEHDVRVHAIATATAVHRIPQMDVDAP